LMEQSHKKLAQHMVLMQTVFSTPPMLWLQSVSLSKQATLYCSTGIFGLGSWFATKRLLLNNHLEFGKFGSCEATIGYLGQVQHHVVARILATSGMCSWKALIVGEWVPRQPQKKNGTPHLHYLFVLLGTKYFTLRIRRYGAATLYTHVEQ
jgi:hypothetical protein